MNNLIFCLVVLGVCIAVGYLTKSYTLESRRQQSPVTWADGAPPPVKHYPRGF